MSADISVLVGSRRTAHGGGSKNVKSGPSGNRAQSQYFKMAD